MRRVQQVVVNGERRGCCQSDDGEIWEWNTSDCANPSERCDWALGDPDCAAAVLRLCERSQRLEDRLCGYFGSVDDDFVTIVL